MQRQLDQTVTTSSNDVGGDENKNSLFEVIDENGVPTGYGCRYQTTSARLRDSSVSVQLFYDLVYPCNMKNKNDAASYIAEEILMDAAFAWNLLPAGRACTDPFFKDRVWLFGVSSEGPADFISDFGCQKLTPQPVSDVARQECCQVVRLQMRFLPTGVYNETELQKSLVGFVENHLESRQRTSTVPFRTAPIEPIIPPSIAGDGSPGDEIPRLTHQESQAKNSGLTVTGGFIVACLSGAFLGLLFLLVRKYRRRSRQLRFVVKEEDTTTDDNGNSYDDPDPDFEGPTTYAFDLSGSFRDRILTRHLSPTILPVVAAYDEKSEAPSEVDSWAQSDGTVGSLEERLEAITAEI